MHLIATNSELSTSRSLGVHDNTYLLHSGCGANIRDWLQLRKHTFDNMSTYLAKKEERIRSKVAAKETTEVEAEGILEPHPPKAPRLETAEGHSQD